MEIKEEYQEKNQGALDFLNQEQREAVETIDGPVVVVAGPGTGKTQILTLRIANILKTKGPELAPNILALTFTNAGVVAMRKRLASFVGVEIAYQVGIFTFHSFAEEQIRSNPEIFTDFSISRAISDIEKIEIVEGILKRNKWESLQTFASDYHYTRDIISAIDDLKSEAISPDKFEMSILDIKERVLKEAGDDAFYRNNRKGKWKEGDIKPKYQQKIDSQIQKQKELLKVYREYQEELKKRKLYDFSDMILSVLQEIENNENFRKDLQEKYLYLLVDEHQDTNEAQNKLIELIGLNPGRPDWPNIFTVGDEKQAIYRFQGASLEIFTAFRKKYKNIKLINLKNNYRSSQKILDTAFSLLPSEIELKAGNKNYSELKEKVKVCEFSDKKTELIYLAEEIKKKIDSGVDVNEIAIFYKQNNEVDEIKKILDKFDIQYKVNSKENILDNIEIKKLFLFLDVVNNPYDDEKMGKLLFVNFLGFNPFDILKVLKKMSYRQGEDIKNKSILKIISSEKILKRIEVEEVEKFLEFSHFLRKMKVMEENSDFMDFFEKFINKSGYLKHLLKLKNNVFALSRLEKIYEEIKKQIEVKKDYRLKDFLNYIEILKKYDLKIEAGKNDLLDGVNLMTAHGSKGLEYEYVYIVNFVDARWGGTRKRGKKFLLPTTKVAGDIDDERRLFYVALTRGKKEVSIYYSKQNEDGKEMIGSRFLEEINKDLLEFHQINDEDYAQKISIYFKDKNQKVLSIFDKEYIKKLFLESALSVSALNNYYTSPIKYFFENLIKLPSKKGKTLIFGNLIHRSLELFFTFAKKEKEIPGLEKLLEIYDLAIKEFLILEEEYQEIYDYGKKVLENYYQRYKDEFLYDVETEKKVLTEMELKNGEKIKLYGIIDKIEKIGDNKIRCVDYKTGKVFKEKGKKDKEKLERQLVFYKILLDKFYNEDRMEEAVLDFVEPEKKTGEFVRERRFISKSDLEKLEFEIENFAEDILSGKFLEREYEKTKENEKYFELWELLKNSEK